MTDGPWTNGKPGILIASIKRAALAYGVTPPGILQRSQEPSYVAARRKVAREMRECGWSLNRIGRALGGYSSGTIVGLLNKDGWLQKRQNKVIGYYGAVGYDPSEPDLSGEWAI